jgi:hypothetical protein
MQSEDVVCLSSRPRNEVWPACGAVLADLVLPEAAFRRTGYERDQPSVGVQTMVGALSTRLAAMNA